MGKQHPQHSAGVNYQTEFEALDEDIKDAVGQLTQPARQQWWNNFVRWTDRRMLLETFEAQLKTVNPNKLGNIYSRIKQVEKDIAKCEETSNNILHRRASSPIQDARSIADSITNNGPRIRPGQGDYSTLVKKREPKPANRYNKPTI